MHSLNELECKGIPVFYRPDYNVPVKKGEILDDFRIKATFPTLDLLIKKGAKIIIGTHLGRPDGHPLQEFDLRPVAEYLADHYPKQTVRLVSELYSPGVEKTVPLMKNGDIMILPNLRFYPEEENNNQRFAETLAHLADVYVNDAFAADHRKHASIVGVPKLLPAYSGLLLEKEIENLQFLIEKPAEPFAVIMGGAKVSDKIEVIEALAKKANKLLIGGAMANTFLLARGEDIGISKAEPDKVDLAEKLLNSLGEKLVIAPDYVKEESDEGFRYLDIGPAAVGHFKEILADAKTIFWNGSLGYAEDPRFAVATQEIAEYIGGLKGVKSVVAGGDTVEMISKLKLHDKFSFVSTGGGAALEFLAGKELPGMKALERE